MARQAQFDCALRLLRGILLAREAVGMLFDTAIEVPLSTRFKPRGGGLSGRSSEVTTSHRSTPGLPFTVESPGGSQGGEGEEIQRAD